jgi:hypothetical protein
MPFCPSCRTEYRPELARCADCDVELVDSLPEEESGEINPDAVELVELASFPNPSEAKMIQELLESNGIGTVIRGDADSIGATSGAEPRRLAARSGRSGSRT